jgi:riboflavin transporter FmnP
MKTKPKKSMLQWMALFAAIVVIVMSLVFAATLKRDNAHVPGWIFYWLYGYGAGLWFGFLIWQWFKRRN